MDLFQVIVLSVIEGLTEFIPVSSTGHLIIIEKLFGWKVPFAFNLIIQVGAFCAVLFYFREKITRIVKATKNFLLFKFAKRTFDEKKRLDARLGIAIIFATIPAALAGVILQGWIEKNLHNGSFVALVLIVFGFVMSYFDKKTKNEKNLQTAGFGDIFKVGLWQMLALIPGVSRSGATMSGALSLGFRREDAAELSFILGLPLILGAGLKGVFDLMSGKENINVNYLHIAIGFTISFVVGLLAINFLVKFLRSNSFRPFVIYRIIAGIFFLILFTIIGS